MHLAIRPLVTTGIAIVGATVLVATPLSPPPAVGALSERAVPVESTASVTPLPTVDSPVDGFTNAFDLAFRGLGQSAANTANWIGAAPATLLWLIEQVMADPAALPNAISSAIHSLIAMPSPRKEVVEIQARIVRHSLVAGALLPLLEAAAYILPPPIGTTGRNASGWLVQGAEQMFDLVNGALAMLPDPLVQRDIIRFAVEASSFVTDLVEGFGLMMSAVGESVQGVANWVGAVPRNLVSLAQAVIADPSQLPNALSTVVFSLIAMPDIERVKLVDSRYHHSLLAAAVSPLARALDRVLPAPFGTDWTTGEVGLVQRATLDFSRSVNGVLRELPEPLPLPRPGGPIEIPVETKVAGGPVDGELVPEVAAAAVPDLEPAGDRVLNVQRVADEALVIADVAVEKPQRLDRTSRWQARRVQAQLNQSETDSVQESTAGKDRAETQPAEVQSAETRPAETTESAADD